MRGINLFSRNAKTNDLLYEDKIVATIDIDSLNDELDALDEGQEKRDKAKNKSVNLDKLKTLVWFVPSALIAFILVRTIMNPTFIFTNWHFMLIADRKSVV